MKKFATLLLSSIALVACNGGGSCPNPSGPNYATIMPYPFPTPGSFAEMPNNFGFAIPSFVYGVSSVTNGLQIAYGYNTNPEAPNLVAEINMFKVDSVSLCSATPVASDGNGGTWLVSAAHCFTMTKSEESVVLTSDLVPVNNIWVRKGVMGMSLVESSASVFVPKDYCYGAKFSSTSGGCPNFNPSDGVVGGQGNDIALIHINRKFNANEVYPQLAPPESYPQQYTMAPILSLGFGVNNVNGRVGQMFYVTNYFYQKSDSLGYHYLHNSYFNTNATNFGYSALICGGDSGGPDLFWNGHNWILLSEHTYGLSDSCGGFYNELTEGATNVSSYYGWLTSIMNATNPVAYCQTESANCTANS